MFTSNIFKKNAIFVFAIHICVFDVGAIDIILTNDTQKPTVLALIYKSDRSEEPKHVTLSKN